MDLFRNTGPDRPPLAERMRPTHMAEMVGQERLKQLVDRILGPRPTPGAAPSSSPPRELPSLILWGPPGCGKTTFARLLAHETTLAFEPFSAVLGGVKEVREIVERAKERRRRGLGKTLLFVDEIHRFNRSQQDAFLPHVEDGTLILVGATTENPSFTLNAALLSRARVVQLTPLATEDLVQLLERALGDQKRGVDGDLVSIAPEVIGFLAAQAGGDARRALSDLEIVAQASMRAREPLEIPAVQALLGRATIAHDRAGDSHHDLASALIKSLRGSDPDAGLYYLARLIEGGEDPRFICRRLAIFASEDIGNADPRAIGMAMDCWLGIERIGLPEGRILLGQLVTYLATAPKSNASYVGIDAALERVRETGPLPVPMHLRNAPTATMKSLGYAKGYRYPHDHGGWVDDHYLPDNLVGQRFYEPVERGYERHIADRLRRMRDARDGLPEASPNPPVNEGEGG
jgi:putative ATPase